MKDRMRKQSQTFGAHQITGGEGDQRSTGGKLIRLGSLVHGILTKTVHKTLQGVCGLRGERGWGLESLGSRGCVVWGSWEALVVPSVCCV